MSDSLPPHGLQHARLPCPPLSPGICSSSCPLSYWCYLTITTSITPSPLALNLSQHQGLFQWVSSSHQVAKVLEFQLQHQSFQWNSELISFRIDWFDLLAVQGILAVFSRTTVQSRNSCTTLTSVHDYWKNHSFGHTDICWQINVCFLICCLDLS